MAKHKVVFVVAAVVAVGIPAYMLLRKRDMERELGIYLAREHFQRLRDCGPRPAEISQKGSTVACWEGKLDAKRDIKATLLLGTRQRVSTVGRQTSVLTDSYIGVRLPPGAKIDAAWLATKPGGALRSMRESDGGTLILWNELHTRDNVVRALDTARSTLSSH
jgi:hypothetical protein